MSSCVAFKTLWSDWQEGSLSEADNAAMVSHLETCEFCQIYNWQMKDMLNGLSGLRERALLSQEGRDRVFNGVYTRSLPARRHKLHYLAAAASLFAVLATTTLLWSITSSQLKDDPGAILAGRTPVSISLAKVQNVKLSLDSKKDISNVTFTINLPKGVEVSGFPKERRLSWVGELRAGRNNLTLPLIATTMNSGNVVTTQIEYGDIKQKLELVLHQSANGWNR